MNKIFLLFALFASCVALIALAHIQDRQVSNNPFVEPNRMKASQVADSIYHVVTAGDSVKTSFILSPPVIFQSLYISEDSEEHSRWRISSFRCGADWCRFIARTGKHNAAIFTIEMPVTAESTERGVMILHDGGTRRLYLFTPDAVWTEVFLYLFNKSFK